MKKIRTSTATCVVAALMAVSCGSEPAAEEATTRSEEKEAVDELLEEASEKEAAQVFSGPVLQAPENAKLKVFEAPPAPSFPGAKIGLQMRPDQAKMEAAFNFNVMGYELGAQTEDATERGCANSNKGQHIHFILNNKPYQAHYNKSFTESVDPGRNVLLTFLSRSYHESLKDMGAYTISKFNMKGESEVPDMDLYEDPILFYSRPKGDYKKSSGDKVLLDFFVLNVTLSPEGYRVKATIDGEEWTLHKWTAYFIEGMEAGEHSVRLQLIDGNGDPVPGHFNDSGDRKFNITEG